MKIKWCYFY